MEGNDQTGRPIWNYAMGTLTSWKGARPDRIIQLNCGEVRALMQVVKQLEHGRTSTTDEQK